MNEEDLKIIESLKEKAVQAQMFDVAYALREPVKLLRERLN